jgi:hypothetical protein
MRKVVWEFVDFWWTLDAQLVDVWVLDGLFTTYNHQFANENMYFLLAIKH